MRSLLTLLAALFFTTIHSQNYRYYRPGQKISDPQNACLVFSEKQKKNHTAKSLAEYRPVKAIKFSGYQSDNSVFDSLLSLTMRNLDPETVIFENCDLSTLTVPLAGYRSLANLSALKNCSFMEGDLYALLKTSGVKRLRLQVQEGDFESDSLYHLPDLEKIEISNTPNFNKANKTRQVQLVRNGNLQTVSIGFYGSLYQNEKDEVSLQRTVMPNSENQALNKEFKSLAYDWLKAPLPGVKINDTVYNYFPGRRNSFAYYSGSSISIDADAFVYQDGNKYSGPVQINYREFRDPVEIMLSGIPMTVAVNGETRLLTSGGMYEISALDEKGNELMTKSDTAIKVNFALSDTSSSFGFYTMDKNGNWDLTDQKVISVPKALSDTISGESMAVRVYRDYSGRRNKTQVTAPISKAGFGVTIMFMVSERTT